MENKRKTYLDILNIIAILAVIALHCNGGVHGNPMYRAWNTSLIVECICYFAVPVFFMISGANLMKYRERYDTKTFFKKRLLKVLVPFIAWAIIMFIWKIFIINTINLEEINSPIKLLNAFFTNKEENTYYFMFEILGIYLSLPLLSLLAKKEYEKPLWITTILFFIFNATIPNILSLFKIQWNTSLAVPITGYAMYVILGYLLSETKLSKKQKAIIYIGAVIGLLYRYITTFILSKNAGIVIKTTWGYSSWHSILLATSVFTFIKDLRIYDKINKNKRLVELTKKIAGCSFGIYLIHMIVKHYIIEILNINPESWIFRTGGIVVVYIVSLIIVLIVKKIPVIKKIVP